MVLVSTLCIDGFDLETLCQKLILFLCPTRESFYLYIALKKGFTSVRLNRVEFQ